MSEPTSKPHKTDASDTWRCEICGHRESNPVHPAEHKFTVFGANEQWARPLYPGEPFTDRVRRHFDDADD
jgi:hypothetical protein